MSINKNSEIMKEKILSKLKFSPGNPISKHYHLQNVKRAEGNMIIGHSSEQEPTKTPHVTHEREQVLWASEMNKDPECLKGLSKCLILPTREFWAEE